MHLNVDLRYYTIYNDIYICLYIHACIHTYKYIHTYIHTYPHIHPSIPPSTYLPTRLEVPRNEIEVELDQDVEMSFCVQSIWLVIGKGAYW